MTLNGDYTRYLVVHIMYFGAHHVNLNEDKVYTVWENVGREFYFRAMQCLPFCGHSLALDDLTYSLQ